MLFCEDQLVAGLGCRARTEAGEYTVITWVGKDGGMEQVGATMGSEKRSTLGYILKVKPEAFANGWDVGCERKTFQG